MNNSSISLDELRKNDTAKCTLCKDGWLYPVFPEHEEHYDWQCDKCGAILHIEFAVDD